jgi:hypothetical protein
VTNPIIPAPSGGGHGDFFVTEEPFEVGPEITVYQAAMVYAGRHPCERLLGVGSDHPPTPDDYLAFLKGGMERRVNVQQSWDIWCELAKRIEAGEIKPVRCRYARPGKMDFVHTVIRLVDVARLATERGEHPEYLQHVQAAGAPAPVDAGAVPLRNKSGPKDKGPEIRALVAADPFISNKQLMDRTGAKERTVSRHRNKKG